jgi:hypothetical protein
MNLGKMCYLDKKPLWRTQKQRDLNQSNIQMQYIEFFFAFKSFVENIYHKTFHTTLSSKVPNMEM